jgi:hypothetical protein
MDIQGRLKLEDLVTYDNENTAYKSAEQNIEYALSLLHAHETWFAEHRAENQEESSNH